MEGKTMWRKRYLKVLNSITIICVVIGCMINMMKFAGMAVFSFFKNSDSAVMTEGGGDLEGFSDIDAELKYGELIVKYGDSYSFSYDNYPQGSEPTFKIKNNKLEIRQKGKVGFNLLGNNNFDGKVIVTLPQDTVADMELNLNMGSLNLSDMYFGNINVDADMGSITIKNCEMEKVNLQADMGSIDLIDCEFTDGDFDANMGGITLKDCSFQTADCDADMGSIEVSGVYDALTADCDMGSIKAENSNENAKYDLDCDMGDIKVNGKKLGKEYKN